MKTIWKFPIQTTDEQIVSMPIGAEILCVQVHNAFPCLWALVNPINPQYFRIVRVVGTGHPCFELNMSDYVGTYQLPSGLVFHVFVSPEVAA